MYDIDGTPRFTQTSVHTAAFAGHPYFLLWLLQGGVDPSAQLAITSRKDEWQKTPKGGILEGQIISPKTEPVTPTIVSAH